MVNSTAKDRTIYVGSSMLSQANDLTRRNEPFTKTCFEAALAMSDHGATSVQISCVDESTIHIGQRIMNVLLLVWNNHQHKG